MASGPDKTHRPRADIPSAGGAFHPSARGARGARVGSEPRAVVEAYLDALAAHDYERARAYLSDGEFCYRSPISVFNSADDFTVHLSLSAGILQRVDRIKVFADGEDVCHFLDMVIQISDKETVRAAQWCRVSDGRIVRIELLFDAHQYRMMFQPPCAEAQTSPRSG